MSVFNGILVVIAHAFKFVGIKSADVLCFVPRIIWFKLEMRARIMFQPFCAPSLEFVFDAFCLSVLGMAGFISAIALIGNSDGHDLTVCL